MMFALIRGDVRRLWLFALLAFVGSIGCQSCCTDVPIDPPRPEGCTVVDCGEQAFRFGKCINGGCASDEDCCPGTRCRTDINSCFPALLGSEFECEVNEDCSDPAQTCATIVIGDRAPLPACVFAACATGDDCAFGQSCFRNRCVGDAPCDGGCPAGSVCDVTSSTCQPFAVENVDKVCNEGCPAGRMMVLRDEATMSGEQCCPLACECVAPPALAPSRYGRYARILATPLGPVVSSYDAEFGDLVLARFTPDGEFLPPLQYVDGVPVDGAITADPIGPRGGVAAPGDDVGTHTSITMDPNGRLRVAYRDVTHNALKVAIEDATGQLTTHTVDSATTGKLGEFTDIAVSATGTIAISYFAHDVELATGRGTGLKMAMSRNATPASAADWVLLTVDGRAMPAAGLRPDSEEVPRGRGLFSAVAFDGADALTTYYDAIDLDLRIARISNGVATATVLDGDGVSGRRSGDIGRSPTLAITGNNLLVVYSDSTRHDVRFWQGPKTSPGTGGTYGDVDRGITSGQSGKAFVGAGARVAIDSGRTALVYQDATTLDLKLATLSGVDWSPTAVRADGPYGFYSDVDVRGGRAYICSVVALLDARGQERSRLQVDVQALP
jgi:hypothetical protein